MSRSAVARGRAPLLTACLSVALVSALSAPAIGTELAEPEPQDSSSGISSATLAEPWSTTQLDGAAALAGGHGRFVAVGTADDPAGAAAWWSVDGLAWEQAEFTDDTAGSGLTQVIETDDGFVALGAESEMYGSTKERVRAWYSADGQSWEPAIIKKPSRSGLQAIAAGLAEGPAGTLALGSFIGQDLGGQRLWRSEDGRSWQPARLPRVKDPVWYAVVSYPKGYLLLGQSGRGSASNWKSTDGLVWKRLPGTPRLFDVAVGENGVLAGIGYKHIYESPEGPRSWEKAVTRPKSWKVGGSNAFSFVEWDGAEFVVPGNDFSACGPGTDECHTNPLLVSVDGKSWSEAAGPDGLPGADAGTWITDIASLGDATAVLGQQEGQTVVWLVGESPADA